MYKKLTHINVYRKSQTVSMSSRWGMSVESMINPQERYTILFEFNAIVGIPSHPNVYEWNTGFKRMPIFNSINHKLKNKMSLLNFRIKFCILTYHFWRAVPKRGLNRGASLERRKQGKSLCSLCSFEICQSSMCSMSWCWGFSPDLRVLSSLVMTSRWRRHTKAFITANRTIALFKTFKK